MRLTEPELPQEERRAAAPAADEIVLVGNPNVGKSALFGALTGAYVTVSNYPGTTVEVATGHAVLGGRRVAVIDTPGAASLLPSSEDERVTRDLLLSERPRTVLVVGDAKNLERTLLLALQVAETGVPFVLCLNMMDEARAAGLRIDEAGLARRLGTEVVSTVAVRREGIARLISALEAPRAGGIRGEYGPPIERAIASVIPLLPRSSVSPRALALMALCGDRTLAAWLAERMSPDELARVEDVGMRLRAEFSEPLAYAVNRTRLRTADRLRREVVVSDSRPLPASSRLGRYLDRATTHPIWGVPFLLAVLYLSYLFVGVFGAKILVDLLENGLFGRILSPAAVAAANRWVPWTFVRDLFVGPYGLITMALAYALALILPIVSTFFLAFGVLEDSGYLPRLAVMVNRVFKKMGLNGKAVLPMVLGLGCDTMATLTTRILETPKERLIVILLLALGVPCSAQLTVVMAMLSGLSPWAMVIWLGVVIGVIVAVGRLAASVLPGRGSDFVLELPPLRMPRPGNLGVKTLARIEWYLREAVPLFVLGTLLLFFADRLRLLGLVERAAEPLLTGMLGLPRQTAEAFVVGFLRRDFGAAGLFQLAREGGLDPVQILVAMVTITLFIPCIANFFMIVKERGWKTALAIAGFIFPFAIGVGAGLNLLLRALPVSLR
ncbi:MAG TPA: ferrous iron transport protein B [Thermoanaerobaculia bacterium]|nr:ferrous iron transport protein B [Thermoanaerobaculia bacterium]